MSISGNIPERLMLICRTPKKTNWSWDGDDLILGGEKVLPTFISDAANEKTIATGRSWAGSYSNKLYIEAEVPNDPIEIRILSLEQRSEGGRAYKVVWGEKNFYADLREDVLLDIILEAGITKGGVPNAKFIWGKVGSQMKLVRVGSHLHDQLKEATQRGKLKPLSTFDIGGIYANKSGEKFIYLGEYIVFDYKVDYGRTGYYQEKLTYAFKKRKVWYKIWKEDKDDEFYGFQLEFLSSKKTVYEKVGDKDLGTWDWQTKVREYALKSYQDGQEREKEYGRYYDPDRRKSDYAHYMRYLHFFDIGDTPEYDSHEMCDIFRE